MPKEEVKSILVVRSAPLPRTFEVLRKLREEYPIAKISILVQLTSYQLTNYQINEVKNEIEKSGLVDEITSYR